MPFPTTLHNNFNQGKSNLELSVALLNPYAKWMQSPNIPRNPQLPFVMNSMNTLAEDKPNVEQWFNQLESDQRKSTCEVPLNFPIDYHSNDFYSIICKGEDRWIDALLYATNKYFSIYSDSSKESLKKEIKIKVANTFMNTYNASIFRLYKCEKDQIYASLIKNICPASLHIYSTVFDKNIIVMRDYGYEWCSLYSTTRDTLCFWENNNNVGVILSNKSDYIDITPILRQKKDIFETRRKRINLISNKSTLEKCKDLNKLKLSDLRDAATSNNIIFSKDNTKDEIINLILDM